MNDPMQTFTIERKTATGISQLGTVQASSMGELRDALAVELQSEAWAFAFQAAFDLGNITIGTITVRAVTP